MMKDFGKSNTGLLLWATGLLFTLVLLVFVLPGSAGAGSAYPDPIARSGATLPFPLFTNEPPYAAIHATESISIYLPVVHKAEVCVPTGEIYSALTVLSAPTDRPAEAHADLNLALRSYEPTTAYLGLLYNIPGPTDPNAPQLPGLFIDNRTATFASVYRVYNWDWGCNCRGSLIANPEVTLAGLATTPGEIIRAPSSGYTIGSMTFIPEKAVTIGSGGYEALVLYASEERITLKYTREDNVVTGYTIHVEGVCVDPNLLALYHSWNDKGRSSLPALKAGQGFGRATGSEIQVAIRDCGTFMEPRSQKDWWQGR